MSNTEQASSVPLHLTRGLGRAFGNLWWAASTSTFGTAITDIAVPLIAVSRFHASPFQISAIVAIEQVSWLLIGLPAGVWVDRLSRKVVLVVCDVGRFAVVASVPVAAILGFLTLRQLFVVAGLIGLMSVFFTVAHLAIVPSLVPPKSLATANGRLSAATTGASLGGRGISGLLVQLLGAPASMALDAVSYLTSCVLISALPRDREKPSTHERRHFGREVLAGLRITLGDPVFRTITLSNAVSNFCAAGQYSLMIVFLVEVLHVPSVAVGLLAGVGGIGGIIGAAAAGKISHALGTGRAWRAVLLIGPVFALLIPMAAPGPSLVLLIVGAIGLSAAIAVGGVISSSARQALCPSHLVGRMSATSRVITWGVLPLGAILAGTLASTIGIRGALWAVCAGFFGAPLLVRTSALWKVQDLQAAPTALLQAEP